MRQLMRPGPARRYRRKRSGRRRHGGRMDESFRGGMPGRRPNVVTHSGAKPPVNHPQWADSRRGQSVWLSGYGGERVGVVRGLVWRELLRNCPCKESDRSSDRNSARGTRRFLAHLYSGILPCGVSEPLHAAGPSRCQRLPVCGVLARTVIPLTLCPLIPGY